jgi:predicted TIM-barrel fold metal-dependent hydrolase
LTQRRLYNFRRLLLPASIAALLVIAFFSLHRLATSPTFAAGSPRASSDAANSLQDFAAIDPIDTHVHAFKTDPAFTDLLVRLRLHVLDIAVADSQHIFGELPAELTRAKSFVGSSQNHAKLCTTFNPFDFERSDFTQNTIKSLRQQFADGAIAVKIWKNIGMELKTSAGRYVMPDDPAFRPILREIAAQHKTLVAHIAEPSSCWQPPDPNSPDHDYYTKNPEWYMYAHPERPRKEALLAARDHLLAENPTLRVVGAHLGSMEVDVDEIAKRLDRYPNFAVDTAARMEYLMLQPREKVRNFLIKYQDRILYGTDLEFLADESLAEAQNNWQETYAHDWKFLATNETLDNRGRKIQGLQLPASVLRRIYHDNAVRWFPGISPN